MHVPDGFLDVPTSLATAAAAGVTVAVALRRAGTELPQRSAPLAGLVAAFVFAVQMLNFPVGVGTSGHLLGGTLAAVLVGPWTAILCLTVVLLVQTLLFADGGLTALGTNVTLLGIVTVLVGYAVTRTILPVLPRRPRSVVPAAFVGAFLSVPVAAAAFTGLYAVGGAVDLPLGALLSTMVGWHLIIGLGEALITAATVSAVVATRPDLVHAARGLRPALLLHAADGTTTTVPAAAPTSRSLSPAVLGVGLAAAVILAGGMSVAASDSPDGLERVAEDQGFLDSASESLVGSWSLADYGAVGGVPVGVAGVVGVGVTVVAGYLLQRAAARRRPAAEDRRPLKRV